MTDKPSSSRADIDIDKLPQHKRLAMGKGLTSPPKGGPSTGEAAPKGTSKSPGC